MLYRFCRAVSAHTGTPTTDRPRCAAATAVIVAGVEALVAWLGEVGPAPTAADITRLLAARDEFWPNADPSLRGWADNVVSLSQFPARWEAAQAWAGTGNPRELAILTDDLRPYTFAVKGWNFPVLQGQRDVSTPRRTAKEPFDLPASGEVEIPRRACSAWNNRNTRFASDPREVIPWQEVEKAYPYAEPLMTFLLKAAHGDPRIARGLLAEAEVTVAEVPRAFKRRASVEESLEVVRANVACTHALQHNLSVIFGRGSGTPEDLRVRALRCVAEQFLTR